MKLHPVINDTDGPAYCGPTVLCALTGQPLSEVLAAIKGVRESYARDAAHSVRYNPDNADDAAQLAAHAAKEIVGTFVLDIEEALEMLDHGFGFGFETLVVFDEQSRPTLGDWVAEHVTDDLAKQLRAGAAMICGIGNGEFGSAHGHWIIFTIEEFLDTGTGGSPIPVAQGLDAYWNIHLDDIHLITDEQATDALFRAAMDKVMLEHQPRVLIEDC